MIRVFGWVFIILSALATIDIVQQKEPSLTLEWFIIGFAILYWVILWWAEKKGKKHET